MDPSLEQITRQLEAFLRPECDPRQARKRERILAAATEQFIAHGYRKTSVEDIARAAGVAKGTIYLYYRSKPELLFHAAAREKLGYVHRLAPVLEAHHSATDRLREFIVLGMTLSRSMPLVTRLTGGDHELDLAMQEVDADVLERINRLQMTATVELIDAATGHCWPRQDLEQRAEVLIDMMFALMTSGRMIRHGMPIENYAELLADVVVHGVVHAPRQRAGTPAPVPAVARAGAGE